MSRLADVDLTASLDKKEAKAQLAAAQERLTHLRHILAKLDLRDRAQAIVLAHECGLVADETAPR